jgi:hypothetical protein
MARPGAELAVRHSVDERRLRQSRMRRAILSSILGGCPSLAVIDQTDGVLSYLSYDQDR